MRIEPYLDSLTPHAPFQTKCLINGFKSPAHRLMEECVNACINKVPLSRQGIDGSTTYTGHLGPFLIEAASVFLPELATADRLIFLESALSDIAGQLSSRKAFYIHAEMVDTLHSIDPRLSREYIKRLSDKAFAEPERALLSSLVAAQASDAEVSCTHYFTLLKGELLSRPDAQNVMKNAMTLHRYERALVVLGLQEWAATLPRSSRKRMIDSDFGL